MKGWTADEKSALVDAYTRLPYGRKKVWLAAQGVSYDQLRVWRKAFYFGDLDRDLVPRDTAHMTVADGARLARLEAELAGERAARAREKAEHDAQVARLRATNEALGNAIGLLRGPSDAQEPTAGS